MSEHADGDAYDLPPATVVVEMPARDGALPLPHTAGLLQLTGVQRVGRPELPDGRVVWVPLLLEHRLVGRSKSSAWWSSAAMSG